MAREFNVKFSNVEMVEGMDGLLENTQITKVIFVGDNVLKSLDSTFKDCPQLTTIVGDINLDEVSDIDNMLEGNMPLDVSLKNITNEKITAENSLLTTNSIIIGGESYEKDALQNVIGSLDWLSRQYTFEDIVEENLFENSTHIENSNKIIVKDSLEQRATGIEIQGETYQNLINGKGNLELENVFTIETLDGSPTDFATENGENVSLEVIEGKTIEKGRRIRSIGELQEDGTYKINIRIDDYSHLWRDL